MLTVLSSLCHGWSIAEHGCQAGHLYGGGRLGGRAGLGGYLPGRPGHGGQGLQLMMCRLGAVLRAQAKAWQRGCGPGQAKGGRGGQPAHAR